MPRVMLAPSWLVKTFEGGPSALGQPSYHWWWLDGIRHGRVRTLNTEVLSYLGVSERSNRQGSNPIAAATSKCPSGEFLNQVNEL